VPAAVGGGVDEELGVACWGEKVGFFVSFEDACVPFGSSGKSKGNRRTCFVQRQEPEGCCVDCFADLFFVRALVGGQVGSCIARMPHNHIRTTTYRDEAVVLQDDGLAIPETLCDFLAFFAVQHHSAKVLVDGVVFVEAQAVLGDHVELAAEDREGFAVDAVHCGRVCQFA